MATSEGDVLSSAISACGDLRFWGHLRGLLRRVVPHDTTGIFLYSGAAAPVRLWDSEGGARRDEVHDVLARVGYLISPYYNNLIRPRAAAGWYHLSDVAPDDFLNSEYFHAYYAVKTVCDEGMFHIPVSQEDTIVVMVERSSDSGAFEPSEIAALRGLAALVIALVGQHFRASGGIFGGRGMMDLRRAVECFGSVALSSREREVAMLILRGHSTKSAARVLQIAPETERVHRRRLYSKLGINSHSELFSLFLESTGFFDPVAGNDPLVEYLRQAESPVALPAIFGPERGFAPIGAAPRPGAAGAAAQMR